MREMTATSFRQQLFRILEDAARLLPTRIRYKKGDSVLLSHFSYLNLLNKRKKKIGDLEPLVKGKIVKPLDQNADRELLDYMGIR